MWSCLLVCLLADEGLAKSTPLAPRWVEGQETVYQGVVKEASRAQAIQLQRQYQLEVRILVVSVTPKQVELACCTKLTQQNPSPGAPATASVHLTYCTVDRAGQVLSTSAAGGLPLVIDGPATWENGLLLPAPAGRAAPGLKWEVGEPGRLPRRCTLGLPEPGQAEDAWVVRCEQESLDWQRARADSTAWRRTDRLSYAPRYGLPRHVERVIQYRAPAYQQVTTELKTEYTLVRQEPMDGPMLAERKRDVGELKLFQEEFEGLAAKAGEPDAREALRRLAVRLARYQEAPGRTPYREAAVTLRSLVEAASTGQPVVRIESRDRAGPVKEGEFAPDFRLTAADGTAVTLRQFRGKPCLLVFVRPETALTKGVMEELVQLRARLGGTLGCVVLSVNDRAGQLAPVPDAQWKNLDGRTEMMTYGVQETPTFVLLDVEGSVLRRLTGWGPETRQAIEKLARKELAKAVK